MNVTSVYPVLISEDVSATAAFYQRYFGFVATFETDWYVSLRQQHAPHYELAFLAPEHPSVPEGFATPAKGVLLNVEVADAGAEHARLIGEEKLYEVLSLRDEDWGQRHFIIRDPSGNLVDVIENIATHASYADAYPAQVS